MVQMTVVDWRIRLLDDFIPSQIEERRPKSCILKALGMFDPVRTSEDQVWAALALQRGNSNTEWRGSKDARQSLSLLACHPAPRFLPPPVGVCCNRHPLYMHAHDGGVFRIGSSRKEPQFRSHPGLRRSWHHPLGALEGCWVLVLSWCHCQLAKCQ